MLDLDDSSNPGKNVQEEAGKLALVDLEESVGLGSHNEIVLMQSLDPMRPPIDRYSSIFCDDERVMVLRFCDRSNFVRERKRLGEVLELKYAFKLLDAIHFFELPPRHLW